VVKFKYGAEKILVRICDKTQFCPGFGRGSFHLEQPEKNCGKPETVGRGKLQTKGRALSIGNEHAEFLH